MATITGLGLLFGVAAILPHTPPALARPVGAWSYEDLFGLGLQRLEL